MLGVACESCLCVSVCARPAGESCLCVSARARPAGDAKHAAPGAAALQALSGLLDFLHEALLDRAVLPMGRMEALPNIAQVRPALCMRACALGMSASLPTNPPQMVVCLSAPVQRPRCSKHSFCTGTCVLARARGLSQRASWSTQHSGACVQCGRLDQALQSDVTTRLDGTGMARMPWRLALVPGSRPCLGGLCMVHKAYHRPPRIVVGRACACPSMRAQPRALARAWRTFLRAAAGAPRVT